MIDLKAKLAAKLKGNLPVVPVAAPVKSKPAVAAPQMLLIDEDDDDLFPNVAESPMAVMIDANLDEPEIVTEVDIQEALESFTIGVGVKLSKNYNSYDCHFSATFKYPKAEKGYGGLLIEATKKWAAKHALMSLQNVFETVSPKLEAQ